VIAPVLRRAAEAPSPSPPVGGSPLSPAKGAEQERIGRVLLPPHAPGMRIGLFGGTFDPPHDAHRAACLIAMKRLGLDRVWWLVTPGNPLKDTRGLAPLKQRIAAARALARHPRIDVTGLEAEIGTSYTHATIAYLRRHCPGVRFVWIMGADNLRSFHRWQKWRGIAAMVPMAVVDRLGPSLYAGASAAGQALARSRIPEAAAKSLPGRKPPAWIYLHGLKSPLSSTALRAARHKSDAKEPQYADSGTAKG
jgi:nicotinate-nucleotide adenylyltransferase